MSPEGHMTRYRVHLFPIFRVSLNIESDNPMTPEEAIARAEQIGFHTSVDGMEYVDENAPYVLVDRILPNGDVDYDNAEWFDWKQDEGRYIRAR